MSTAATAAAPAAARTVDWTRSLIGALVIVVLGAAAILLGWDITGWFGSLWDTIKAISLAYLLAAIALKTVQTTAVAFAYFSILRLPANLGTLALLVMLTMIIPGATFAGALAVYGVQKIFFVLIGAFPYLYLFLTVGGSFDLEFEFVRFTRGRPR